MAQLATNHLAKSQTDKVNHRSVILRNGVPDKVSWRLGVTSDEIHRSNALHKLGGSEECYKETLKCYVIRYKSTTKQNTHFVYL